MKIDLIYNYRAINAVYVIYGPEKVNGNIVVLTEGYIVNSISEVINKINGMVATLSPDITNCQSISSGLYGNMYMQIWRGDLNTGSESPDYTQVLNSINSNLSDISLKLKDSGDNKTLAGCLERIFNCFNAGVITTDPNSIRSNSFINAIKSNLQSSANSNSNAGIATILSNIFQYDNGASAVRVQGLSATSSKNQANICKMLLQITQALSSNIGYADTPVDSEKFFNKICNMLKQSVTPNANITDVISALNATIDSKQDTTIVNNEVTPLAEINIDVPFEVKNLKKSDVEN